MLHWLLFLQMHQMQENMRSLLGMVKWFVKLCMAAMVWCPYKYSYMDDDHALHRQACIAVVENNFNLITANFCP